MFGMLLIFLLCNEESWVPMSVHITNKAYGLITDQEIKGDNAHDPI